MTREPRILIISASIGSGHNQAAAAIAQELRRQHAKAQIDIIDFFTYASSSWGNFLKETYFKMLHIFPDMYDFLYRWTSGRGHRVKNLLAYSSKKRMQKICQQYNPDILLFTHPFPCAAAAYLRRKHAINIPIVAVVTDFAVHPLWIYQEVDLYCIASETLLQQLLDKGILQQRVIPLGIPINPKFTERKINTTFTHQLGLSAEEPIVLIMGGGLGFGPLESVLLNLEQFTGPLQLIVVAGNNRELIPSLQSLARNSRHKIRVMGFTEEIDTLMEIADVLITKPGGLTISEALAKQLPMLLISVIPGQEEENAQFLVQQGAAVQVRDIRTISRYLNRLLTKKPETLIKLRTAAAGLAKPEAARHIAKHVLEMVNRFTAGKVTK